MNAIECVPRFERANHYLSRQLILTRDDRPFGSEIRIKSDDSQILSALASHAPATNPMSGIYSEALMQTRLMAFSLKDRTTSSQNKYLSRRFVCVDQSALAHAALTEELIQCSDALRGLGQTLVVALNELPLPAVRFTDKKKILHNVYLLKDHGIEIAFDGFNVYDESIEIFTSLNLFDYIKISISALDLGFKLGEKPELFNRLYERMTLQAHNTKVSFIADRVEHAAGHVLARALPFDYFQGSHYSPADNI
ncbi:EAL domain-containing protein [Pseudomonas sp. PCH199]|uniref:EAL domain-containing protein n=1 Tax=unclassified Pseudomonas TaxID=196821 RepID=UPI000BCDFDD2|nr:MULTISPECIES: EAL domain-containing protein [unclassified Pseudomonas]MCW8277185.1 EAL domain-containing protein [Pseudomonas sp. PCH199]PAM82668.1 EAL domain-containing protein [Pseudomonas sp. ERMR1:02]